MCVESGPAGVFGDFCYFFDFAIELELPYASIVMNMRRHEKRTRWYMHGLKIRKFKDFQKA